MFSHIIYIPAALLSSGWGMAVIRSNTVVVMMEYNIYYLGQKESKTLYWFPTI